MVDCMNRRSTATLGGKQYSWVSPELIILPHGAQHEREIYRYARWQIVLLDGLRAEDMSSYSIARRRAVLLRSMATGFSNELTAVDITSWPGT